MIRRYVPGAGLDDYAAYTVGTGGSITRSWPMLDPLGSVAAQTNGANVATQINAYDEYGVPQAGYSGRFGYAGAMFLDSSGPAPWHMRNRQYNPTLGRFLQTDPIGYGAGLNLYAYVGGDPVNRVDPWGLCGVPGLPHCDLGDFFVTVNRRRSLRRHDFDQVRLVDGGYGGGGGGGGGGQDALPESTACRTARENSEQSAEGASPAHRNSWRWHDQSALLFLEDQARRQANEADSFALTAAVLGFSISVGDAMFGPENLGRAARGARAGLIGGIGVGIAFGAWADGNRARAAERAYRERRVYLRGCQ